MENNIEKPQKRRSKDLSDEEKERIMKKRKADNTNKATDVWIAALKEYMEEKNFGDLDSLSNTELDKVLGNFYMEARKKYVTDDIDPNDPADEERKTNYKNTSLRAARAAFTRFFKDRRQIDIRTHQDFVNSNESFLGKTRDNKEKGLGNVQNKPPITEEDMRRISEYFKAVMSGPPNPKGLLQMSVFYVIYYLCRRGRENLRAMTKKTFAFGYDHESKREFIYQCLDEADKNHGVNDTYIANQGRIYEIKGK